MLIAARDLDAAAEELERRFGLASVVGGRHPGWGTANRIVPLGDTYLEVVAVVDPSVARTNPFGRWVESALGPGLRPMGWAVRVEDIEIVARRLDLQTVPGSRRRPDGRLLEWTTAGVEAAAAEPSLPFWIRWAGSAELPGRTPVAHPAGLVRLAQLFVDGDATRLERWLGSRLEAVVVRPGPARVAGVVLATGGGEIRL